MNLHFRASHRNIFDLVNFLLEIIWDFVQFNVLKFNIFVIKIILLRRIYYFIFQTELTLYLLLNLFPIFIKAWSNNLFQVNFIISKITSRRIIQCIMACQRFSGLSDTVIESCVPKEVNSKISIFFYLLCTGFWRCWILRRWGHINIVWSNLIIVFILLKATISKNHPLSFTLLNFYTSK